MGKQCRIVTHTSGTQQYTNAMVQRKLIVICSTSERASHIYIADVSADVSNSRAADATATSGYRYSTAAAVGTAAAATAVAAATMYTKELTSRRIALCAPCLEWGCTVVKQSCYSANSKHVACSCNAKRQHSTEHTSSTNARYTCDLQAYKDNQYCTSDNHSSQNCICVTTWAVAFSSYRWHAGFSSNRIEPKGPASILSMSTRISKASAPAHANDAQSCT
eukprot:9762-Heterococcus_DN1.PRE.1